MSRLASWSDHFNSAWVLRNVQGLATHLNTTFAFWLVVLVGFMLGLLEVDDVRRKLETLKERTAARVLLAGSTKIAAKFRRYMLIRTAMSRITGVMVWLLGDIVGTATRRRMGRHRIHAELYPLHRPLRRYRVPNAVRIDAIRVLAKCTRRTRMPECIQFAIGSYIEPRVAGGALAISPFIVLFSILLWTYLWGLFGGFHWRADCDCCAHPMRGASVQPLGSPNCSGRPIRFRRVDGSGVAARST